MWYEETKIYHDGSHYIAHHEPQTPQTAPERNGNRGGGRNRTAATKYDCPRDWQHACCG